MASLVTGSIIYTRGSQTFLAHDPIMMSEKDRDPNHVKNMLLTAFVYFIFWGYGSQFKNILTVFLNVFSTHHHIFLMWGCDKSVWHDVSHQH
jgi:dipeptide/tripeptide permease